MVLQWPTDGADAQATSRNSSSSIRPAASSSRAFQIVVPRSGALALPPAVQHRPAGQHDRRDVHRRRRHDAGRRGLVAAGQQHHAVERIAVQHLDQAQIREVAVERRGRPLAGLLDRMARETRTPRRRRRGCLRARAWPAPGGGGCTATGRSRSARCRRSACRSEAPARSARSSDSARDKAPSCPGCPDCRTRAASADFCRAGPGFSVSLRFRGFLGHHDPRRMCHLMRRGCAEGSLARNPARGGPFDTGL